MAFPLPPSPTDSTDTSQTGAAAPLPPISDAAPPASLDSPAMPATPPSSDTTPPALSDSSTSFTPPTTPPLDTPTTPSYDPLIDTQPQTITNLAPQDAPPPPPDLGSVPQNPFSPAEPGTSPTTDFQTTPAPSIPSDASSFTPPSTPLEPATSSETPSTPSVFTPPTPSFTPPDAAAPPQAAFVPAPTPTVFTPPEEAAPPPLPPVENPSMAAAPPPKSSPFRFLIPILLVLLVVGGIGFAAYKFLLSPGGSTGPTGKTTPAPKATETVTITYYGLWEPESVMRPVLTEFEKQNPGIKVDYQMQNHVDYRERLQTALTKTPPPDVVRIHSTWMPMFISLLSAAPAQTITTTEISSNFYPAVNDAVVVGSQVYAVPTTFEGIALFVNESLLSTIQATAPTTWEDLKDIAQKLTQTDDTTGAITQAGAALGTTNNIDHWPDIVSLMMLQNGADMSAPDIDKAGVAIKYYTSFAKGTGRVWDESLPSSVQSFATGKVAMIFAPSWRALDIQSLNPSLKWKIYPVPQLHGQDQPVTWANFWVEAVPKSSAHPKEAWALVKFLASSGAQQILFNSASTARGFGQAPANKAVAETAVTNPIVGPFIQMAGSASTFYTTSLTHDGPTGINSRLIKYLENAVNGYLENQSDDTIIPTLQQGFYQVLSEYNVITPTPFVTP